MLLNITSSQLKGGLFKKEKKDNNKENLILTANIMECFESASCQNEKHLDVEIRLFHLCRDTDVLLDMPTKGLSGSSNAVVGTCDSSFRLITARPSWSGRETEQRKRTTWRGSEKTQPCSFAGRSGPLPPCL